MTERNAQNIAMIRVELTKMQSYLQKSNDILQQFFHNVPSDIPESLEVVKKKYESVQRNLENDKMGNFQNKYSYLNSYLSEIEKEFEQFQNGASTEAESELDLNEIKNQLMELNGRILTETETKIRKQLDLKDREEEKKRKALEKPLIFVSPFKETPMRPIPTETENREVISKTVHKLEGHEIRIDSLEKRLREFLNSRQSRNVIEEDLTGRVRENHQALSRLKVRAEKFQKLFYQGNPKRYEKPEKVLLRSKEPVTEAEFIRLTNTINENYSVILRKLSSMKAEYLQQVSTLSQQISVIEGRIDNFETHVNKLNEAIIVMNTDIDELDDKQDSLQRQYEDKPIQKSQFISAIASYKQEISEMQQMIRGEVDDLNLKLDKIRVSLKTL